MDGHVPRLRFGDSRATIVNSPEQYLELARQARRPVSDISFKSGARSMKFTAVRIGQLTITEGYSEAIEMKCHVDPQLTFIIPFAGKGRFSTRERNTEWRASRTIIQVSYDRPIVFEADRYLLVALRLCPHAFLKEVERIAPQAVPDMDQLLSCGVSIHDGERGTLNVSLALESLLSIIESCRSDEILLQRIGVEDVLYRLLAEFFIFQRQHAAAADRRVNAPRSGIAVDMICDYISHNVGSPLTMGKMERMAGLTGRALNYAFRQRFGCSPQEWQRSFLLDEARKRLLAANDPIAIKGLAYDLGFSSASSFATHYTRRFRERPSETLAASARTRHGLPLDQGKPDNE